MLENQKFRPAQVIGPLGEPLTLDSLPPPSTTRWVVRRKAEVVAAVAGGLLTVDEACQRYTLSLEEFTGWQRAVDRSGMPGCASPASSIIATSTSASSATDKIRSSPTAKTHGPCRKRRGPFPWSLRKRH
jgi:hypothetical protein